MGKIASSIGDLAKKAAIGFAAVGVAAGAFAKSAVGAASDLAESQSKVDVVFGQSAKEIEAWAAGSAKAMGQSKQQALEAAGTFGNLFSAMKIGSAESVKMSKGIVELSSDLASFNNANPADVLVALKAGLVGETEPLRAFGVNLNAARIEMEAARLGMVEYSVNQKDLLELAKKGEILEKDLAEAVKKHGAESAEVLKIKQKIASNDEKFIELRKGEAQELSAAAKAQAAYSLILQDTTLAQGDFARTSDGLANRTRILKAEFSDMQAEIGTKLLPVALALATFVSDELIPAFESLSAWVRQHWPEIRATIEDVMTRVREVITTVLETIQRFWGTWGDEIMLVVRTVFDFIRTWIESTMTIIRGIVNVIMGLIHGDFSQVWDGIKQIFSGALQYIHGLVDAAMGLLRAAISTAMTLIAGIFDAAWDGIKNVVSAALNDVIGFMQALPGRILGALGYLGDLLVNIGTEIINGLFWGITQTAQKMWDWMRLLPTFLKDLLQGAGSWLLDVGVAIIQGIIDGIKSMAGFIKDAVNSIIPDKIHIPGTNIDIGLPHFAAGGFASGLAVVGENGPELAYFGGGGARVFSNAESRRMIGGGGGGGNVINIKIYNPKIDSPARVDNLATSMSRELAVALRGSVA